MNQLYRETKGNLQNSEQNGASFYPKANVVDEKESFVIEMLIPGFAKSDVAVKVEDGLLKITGNKEAQADRKYLRKEFESISLERSFKLSDEIDQENIVAEVRDGILLVKLAKVKVVEPKVKEITIL
ncbi:hypothetical protein BZG02_10185 [Labilibaculum filiforme]|uniref:SHSP domain-containing protein n=2 Tax=Labilibaculum filiforme TaxID=1940526 RepID=A0A2N3HYW7_9BACT|nr:hypothetical protein BZG02_10185 [Labilibaculum filiforme]